MKYLREFIDRCDIVLLYYVLLSNTTYHIILTNEAGIDFSAVSIAVASPATSGFQVMVALVGYLGNACNIMVYPYIVEMCVTYALHGISTGRFVIFKDLCLVLLGLSVFVCGTSALVVRIIHGGD